MTTQPAALDTYLQRLPLILDKSAGWPIWTHAVRPEGASHGWRASQVEALRQLADNHFGHDPDAIHWGHVGDLGRVDQALDDLLANFDGQTK